MAATPLASDRNELNSTGIPETDLYIVYIFSYRIFTAPYPALLLRVEPYVTIISTFVGVCRGEYEKFSDF